MPSFAENLAQLPLVGASAIQLMDEAGHVVATIENKPGTQGSFRVYAYVSHKWQGIGPEAAREALALYAEHTEEARLNPGKHPNIDRLFEVVAGNARYATRLVSER